MVMLSFELSHDSVTDRRLRLRGNIRSHSDDTWFSVSEHSKHRNVMVDYSMAELISAEYEQDCRHSVLKCKLVTTRCHGGLNIKNLF